MAQGQTIGELKKKVEIKKLKADNYPKSEIFIGANLNSNFGILSSTNFGLLSFLT